MVVSIWLFRWFPVLAIIALVVLVSCWEAGVLALPDWSTEIERLRTERISAIDGQVCARLGFPSDSPRHADCRLVLQDVRNHDRQVNTF